MNDTVPSMSLHGTALTRGRQQALQRPDLVPQVRQAVQDRLRTLARPLARPDMQDLLQAQKAFLLSNDPQGFDESLGIAQGYGLEHDDLLAYLHGNIVADLDDMPPPPTAQTDGCTAWARALGDSGEAAGARVVKNRDYRGEHGRLQHVFLHHDPAWGARSLLCLGSLGSPGAFSSGMNTDGLAVVDTQISTRDHGPGWLRYFLMTALLRECRDVPEALELIQAVRHAGGGSLVLGDRQGRVAAVELGHHHPPAVTRSDRWVAHTNHYLDAAHSPGFLRRADDLDHSSPGRLKHVESALGAQAQALTLAQAQALMALHDQQGGSVCRHAHGGQAGTLSCAVYDTARLQLQVSHGPPCEGRWSTFGVAQANGLPP